MTALEYCILALTFLIGLSIIWSSLRTGITPVPSSRKARQVILKATNLAPEGTILELGSGWGHLALAMAKKYPYRQVVGYEMSFVPWLISKLLKQLYRADNLSLKRENFLSHELPKSALLVCYLYPGGMKKLGEKLLREKPEVEMLISNTFALPNATPEQTIRLDDLYKSPIYIYRF